MSHIPVMLNEVLEALQPKDGEIYVDGTFGAGGYTQAILKSAKCKVIAIIEMSARMPRRVRSRQKIITLFPFTVRLAMSKIIYVQ